MDQAASQGRSCVFRGMIMRDGKVAFSSSHPPLRPHARARPTLQFPHRQTKLAVPLEPEISASSWIGKTSAGLLGSLVRQATKLYGVGE
jgi:hypothetical protein